MSDYDITINDLTFFPKISYESEYQLGWYVIKPFKREIIEKKKTSWNWYQTYLFLDNILKTAIAKSL